ncbi:Cobalt-zinc-cadmium resistance protein CzcB [Phycisphaerales bacterium]|nr:Cobalt-zinc-cadmium resistance protein CzcB [Phycisphaerales bacterium]
MSTGLSEPRDEAALHVDRQRLYADLRRLADEAGSRASFLRRALAVIATALHAPHATLYAQSQMDVVEETFTAEGSDPSFWKPALEGVLDAALSARAVAGRIFRARESGLLVAAIAARIDSEPGQPSGAIAAVVPCSGPDHGRELQLILESAAHFLSARIARFALESSRLDPRTELRMAVDLGRVSTFSSPRELAFAITNNLRNVTSADQVALGLARNGRVEVLSISGYDEIKAQSESVRALGAAMEECLDAGAPIAWQREGPTAEDSGRVDWKLHRRWSEVSAGSAVASFPIGPVAEAMLVVSVRRMGSGFRPDEIDSMRRMVEPFAGAFGLVERASRSLREHLRDAAGDAGRWLREPGKIARRALVVAGAAAALWFFFGPMPYTVTATAEVVPAKMQTLGAPFEGVLESAPVVAGDVVGKGDVLATFRTGELRLERERLEAALDVQRFTAGQAVSDRAAPVEVRLARAQMDLLRSQIALLDRRIEASTIRAPFDGLVVSGDLRDRIGQSLPLGEPLFEIADGDRYRLRIRVPERAVDDVRAGQAGSFSTQARPDESEPFVLDRVAPAAEVVDGANVYVAEAEVELDAPWMRPGMEGVGSIDAGTRVTWWVLLHRLTDWLRLQFYL